MLLFAAISLLLMYFSPNIIIASFASLAIGFTSVIPQLLIPLGAQLSVPKDRGKIIGSIMSGLLIGILLSRVISGFIGKYLGWKIIYLIAAILMILLFCVLRLTLPVCPANSKIKYTDLLKSASTLLKRFGVLREAALNGALIFCAFSAFWTSLIFLLQSPVYNLGADTAGLFGLVGINLAVYEEQIMIG